MFHIWQLFSFRFFWFFVIRCMQMRSLICFGIDSLLKTSSECHTKLETESHLTRRGRACQSTEMLISWLLQVRIWIWIWIWVAALCVTATVVWFSSFQFPFEFNQINYVCQWIEASAFRTLINGHFGLIELLQKNWKEADTTMIWQVAMKAWIIPYFMVQPVSNELLSPILLDRKYCDREELPWWKPISISISPSYKCRALCGEETIK